MIVTDISRAAVPWCVSEKSCAIIRAPSIQQHVTAATNLPWGYQKRELTSPGAGPGGLASAWRRKRNFRRFPLAPVWLLIRTMGIRRKNYLVPPTAHYIA